MLDAEGGFLSAEKVEITQEGIIETGQDWQLTYQWGSLLGYRKTKQGIFIFHDQASAIMIPAHNISHDCEEDNLVEALNRNGLSEI